jgi:hypothetical protein
MLRRSNSSVTATWNCSLGRYGSNSTETTPSIADSMRTLIRVKYFFIRVASAENVTEESLSAIRMLSRRVRTAF